MDSPWGHKESDMTEQLSLHSKCQWAVLIDNWIYYYFLFRNGLCPALLIALGSASSLCSPSPRQFPPKKQTSFYYPKVCKN